MAARQQKSNRNSNNSRTKNSKSSTGKNNSRNNRRSQNESGVSFKNEVILLCILAACILLFISNFGVGGVVGETISGFFFGVFGLIAYLFPVVLFIGVAFYISNKNNTIAVVKLIAAALFVIFMSLFIELVVTGDTEATAIDAFKYSFEHKTGGGFIGGLLADLLCKAFGLIGAYVVDIVVLIISMVLITERSFLGGVKKGSKKVYDTAREETIRYKEHAEQRREERERRRMDRKVEGVAVDTRILPPDIQGSDNLNELKPSTQMPSFTKDAMEKLFPEKRLGAGLEEHLTECNPTQEPIRFSETVRMPERVHNSTEEYMQDSVYDRETEYVPEPVYNSTEEYISETIYTGAEEYIPEAVDIIESDYMPIQETVDTERVKRNPRQSQEQISENVNQIEHEIQDGELQQKKEYLFPPATLLKKGTNAQGDSQKHLQETALKLQTILKNFGVNVTITDVSCGPSVTRYELQPEMGVKVSKIVNLTDDIKLNLAAADIRIEAPIPGKAAVGIEVPNKENVMVRFRDMIESKEFQSHSSNICFTAGKDIAGQVIVADIAKMPHLLIAGATGSGKSVCINTIIMSILYKANPEDVKLILIDPKVVELSVYNGIPHLFIPVVTDPKKAAGALHWAVAEMTERYQKFAEYQVRDLKGYNQKIAAIEDIEDETKPKKLPQIVIVVDELADLMMVAPGDVEDAICRLAQLARAAGIHLIIATQRPSVDVITGLIKANMPSRIAFSVSSGVDSRTILDMNGAEKLLGNGDMLFYPQGYQKPLRVQGPFVSDTEVEAVVDFLKNQSMAVYNTDIEEKMNIVSSQAVSGNGGGGNERDAYFVDAGKFVIEKDKGSIGMLQRWFKIGFNRAARIMDQLEEAGVVGPEEGTKPRRILMSMEQFEEYVDEYV